MVLKKYSVRQVEWTEYGDVLRSIRHDVFVIEQNVPVELEWDGLDDTAIHVLATDNTDKPVGTGRLLRTGQIGRMAVLKEYRDQGIGGSILELLVNTAIEKGVDNLFLNSQVEAIGFYRRFGFMEQGDIFLEAGIEHKKMIIPVSRK